jgi:hypothetical protein
MLQTFSGFGEVIVERDDNVLYCPSELAPDQAVRTAQLSANARP